MCTLFSPRNLLAILAISSVFAFGGCASKDEIEAQRRWETDDEREAREVFRSNWLKPSVSDDDKDFFYRSFFKKSNQS